MGSTINMIDGNRAGRHSRYSAVAVVLHWLMAFAIIYMLCLGYWMSSDGLPKADRFALIQQHKSIGIVLLWLITVRLAWRLTHRPPELTGSYPKWEKAAATLGHLALYILMIAMPLSGWFLVSSSKTGLPTLLFHTVPWPHVPGVAANETVHDAAEAIHEFFPWVLIGMIALHVLAVIKHLVIDKQNILPRMWFGSARAFVAALLVVAGVIGAGTMFVNRDAVETPVMPIIVNQDLVPTTGWIIDYANSKIQFGFTHAGAAHGGTFNNWSAKIEFDENDLAKTKISATINTASLSTDDKMYSDTLPQSDWLDTVAFPQATFVSDKVEKVGEHSYVAHGQLTLRGQTKPLDMAFTVTPTGAEATATLPRLDYGIGKQSDDKAEWVGRDIVLTLAVTAKPR